MDRATVLRRIDAMEQMLRDLRNDVLAEDRQDGEFVEIGRQGSWSLKMIQDLYPLIEHMPGVIALFDLSAERAPDIVTFREVLNRSGLSEKQQSGDHARLSWVTKRLFDGEKKWPLETWQAADGESHYRMPTRIAQWWRATRP